MSQHDFEIDNRSGKFVRADINAALMALVTKSSNNTAPEVTYPFMSWVDTSGAFPVLRIRTEDDQGWITIGRLDQPSFGLGYIAHGNAEPNTKFPFQQWVDTNGANPILKIRNSANNAWIVLGRPDLTNLGMMPLTGGVFSASISFSNKDQIRLPVGNSAQRPGVPLDGMVRFNSESNIFEGFKNGSWGELGGGGLTHFETQTIASNGTVNTTTTDQRQFRPIIGNSEPVTLNETPFGVAGGWKNGTEILLVGTSDEHSVVLKFADVPKGVVGSFSEHEITKWKTVLCVWNQSLDRFIVAGVH